MSVRVLLADDSPLFVRWVETELVTEARTRGSLSIVGAARDGRAAIDMTAALRPDIVLMDVHMPVMSGLDAVERIMAMRPTPIVVTTGDPGGREGPIAFEALRRGALDVLPKPERWRLDETERQAWRSRIAGLARVRARPSTPPPHALSTPLVAAPRTSESASLIAIGGSTGGPAALARILALLPADLAAPIVVVQHLAPGFARGLADWLSRVTTLEVRLAEDGERLLPGSVRIAPDGAHLTMARDRLRVTPGRPEHGHQPSVSILFRSVARELGSRALGVLLTGMGRDGADGLAELRAAGACTIAQDEPSSVVWGMPRAAIELGAAERVEAPEDIARSIASLAGRGRT